MSKKNGTSKKYYKKSKKSYKKHIKPYKHITWYPFSKSRTVKLRYHETITINPAMGVAGTYTFSANGLYDPNISGTGRQPYGFDQLCALYNKYHVTGSRMTITPVTSDSYYILGVKLCDITTLNTSTPDYIMEQPGFKKRIIANNASAVSPAVSMTFSAKKFFRLKSKAFVLADDSLSGTTASNPAENGFFIIVFQPATNGQDLSNTTFQVQIDYIATFTGPRELPSST